MSLNADEKKFHENTQAEISAASVFLAGYEKAKGATGSLTVNGYDSAVADILPGSNVGMPKALVDIFDSVGEDGKPFILKALELGIEGYKNANGGEMPRPDMVAAALNDGLLALKHIDGYDSANGTQLNAGGMEGNSVVPSIAVVTIATRIANSLPLVAYLPNANGSNEVPIIYGRNIAKNSYGAVLENDYLDGPVASRQYFDSQFEFAATKDAADAKKYTLAPTIVYGDKDKRTVAADAGALPFMGGRVRVYVNGVEVANDATVNHAKFEGVSSIIPTKHGLTLKNASGDDVVVKVVSGEANLTKNTIEVSFLNELPADTEVTINLIADYERKLNGVAVLKAPSIDVDLIARRVFAYPMRAVYRATREAANQMQRELGLDARGSVTAVVAAKYMLEQNVRMLSQIKRRAKGFGRVLQADLSRGATDTAAFNNTSEQARELLVTISAGKVLINKLLDVVPSGHDIYVTDKMSVLFDNLADDTHYRKISNGVGSPNQITRIGYFDGGPNVYHVPADAGLLVEAANAAEIMLLGRSGEAVRNPFVGFVAMPLTVRESNITDFEEGVTIQAVQAAELNPLERFADQCVVIEVTNLPVALVG